MRSSNEPFIERHADDIPGLATLLLPGYLAARLQPHIGADAAALQLSARYVRFKQGSSCLVRFEGQCGDQPVSLYAKAVSRSNAGKLEKAAMRAAVDGPLGAGRVVLADLLVVAWFFPNDNVIRSLRRYCQPGGDITALGYKPERRFVGLRKDQSGAQQVIKLYKPGAFQASLRLARVSQDIPFLPDLAGHDEKRRAIYLSWKPGTTLAMRLQSGDDTTAMLHATGQLLARLHACPLPPGLLNNTFTHETERLQALAGGLEALAASFAKPAGAIAHSLVDALRHAHKAPVLCHGDFYTNQVLVNGKELSLLDFDDLSAAPAESDVGLFLAHLEFDVLRGRLAPEQCDLYGAAFVSGYLDSRPLDRWLLGAYTAFGMFQLAHRPFRDQMADWPALTERWLDAVAKKIPTAQPACQRQKHEPVDLAAVRPAGVPQLEQALDPQTGYPLVEAAVNDDAKGTSGWHVVDALHLRSKPGRRAVVVYKLRDRAGTQDRRLVGKIRVKGLDRRTFDLNAQLYAWLARGAKTGSLAAPKPVNAVPELDMWLQEWVEGNDGWDAIDDRSGTRMAESVAQALYRFHLFPGPNDRSHTIHDEIAILEARLVMAGDEMPGHHEGLRRLRSHCRQLAGLLPERPAVNIHRDFYPDQVIVADGRVYLLDLDLQCRGDGAVDIGNFVAHVQERDLRVSGQPKLHDAFCRRLIDAYARQANDPGLFPAVDVYHALSLARLLQISTVMPARRPYSERLLAHCERVVERLLPRSETTRRSGVAP